MDKNTSNNRLDFLLANICHLHYLRVRQQLEALRLFRGQPMLLKALWEQEALTQSELAERLHITPATLTKMLARMQKAGFIQRQPDPNDKRISRVYLTEAGHRIQSQVEQVWQNMEQETFASFTSDEQALLRRFFLQIRQNLLNATGEQPWE